MKKISLIAMVGIMCMALIGCGGSETAPEEQSAEQYLEQLEDEVQTMIEEEEAQNEAELEAKYPEGILPAGYYRLVDMNSDMYFYGFWAEYDAEHEEGMVITGKDYYGQRRWFTIPSYYRDAPENCYTYDSETGLYHFDSYYSSDGEWKVLDTFEGYYNAEDDTFVMTYLYSERFNSIEEGSEYVYQRE